jgi:hypothetical protein
MKKMGWSEGEGLGKNKDGISKHIKAIKRDIGEGIGVKEEKNISNSIESEEWWNNSYSSALSKISSKSSDKKKKKRKLNEEASLDTPSLEDLFKATGGKRMGMRARMDQNGKFKRTEEEYSKS